MQTSQKGGHLFSDTPAPFVSVLCFFLLVIVLISPQNIPEFVAVHRNSPDESEADNRPEAVYFKSFLDGDGSGYLDVEEIAKWVEPTGFVQVKRLN